MSIYLPQGRNSLSLGTFARNAARANHSQLQRDLFGFWAIGYSAADLSVNSRGGVQTGGPIERVISPAGIPALKFDGAQRVTVDSVKTPFPNPGDEWTCVSYCQFPTTGEAAQSWQVVDFGRNQFNKHGIGMRQGTGFDEIQGWRSSNATDQNPLGSIFGDDIWHSVAVTYDRSGTIRVHLDGDLLPVSNVNNDTDISTGAMQIGSNTGSSEFYKWAVATVAIYSRVLPAAEIRQHALDPLALVRPRPLYIPAASGPPATNLAVDAAALTLDAPSATVTLGDAPINLAIDAAQLTLDAPAVTLPIIVSPAIASLTLDAPAVIAGQVYVFKVDPAQLTLDAPATDIQLVNQLPMASAQLTLQAQNVALARTIPLDPAQLTLAAPTIIVALEGGPIFLALTTADLQLDAPAVQRTAGPIGIPVDPASVLIDAPAASLLSGVYTIGLASAELALAAQPVLLRIDQVLSVEDAEMRLSAPVVFLVGEAFEFSISLQYTAIGGRLEYTATGGRLEYTANEEI